MNWKRLVGISLCFGLVSLAMTSAWSDAQHTVQKKKQKQPTSRPTSLKKAHKTKYEQFLPSDVPTILIKNATVWTATGKIIKHGSVLIRNGRIAAVSSQPIHDKDAFVIDAKGKHLTPGLIDTHSHLGVYPSIRLRSTVDGNESTRPVTAYAWAEHAVWTQDPAFPRAVAGGTTTAQILPGSANLIGGRGVTLKLKLKRSVQEMKFPHAMNGLKMACGENPKRSHRHKIRTRMGSYAGYRRIFLKAQKYRETWNQYQKALQKWKQTQETNQPTTRPHQTNQKKPKKPKKPQVNINLETLKLALEGKILVHIHCYRAEEMIWMIRLAKEFGFRIRSFHHALEAYKIRDILAREKIAVSTWADWWGFKLEAFDGIQENAAMVAASGGRAIIHSDSAIGIQRLNHEAGKAFYRGRAMGLKLTENEAIRWITYNPAWALGIHKQTGSIEVGKMADLVLWNGHPFSVYTRTYMVFIDGKLVFDRRWPRTKTDFELGLLPR